MLDGLCAVRPRGAVVAGMTGSTGGEHRRLADDIARYSDMMDLIGLGADVAGSAADGPWGTPTSSSSRVYMALAPSCGASTRGRAPRETPRLWQGRARRLAASGERRTLGSLSDLALRSRIIQALANAPNVDVAEIAVECHDEAGVVLRGSVVNMLQRAEAVRTTRHVPGVRAVDDQMRTRPAGAARRADAETEAAVLDALILDDALPAYGIDVDVDVGRVTLCGAVDVRSQRDAAERIALRVPGVSEVRNRLQMWIAVSAEEVAERVTDAIGVEVVGAAGITVTVRDNVVTLAGSVRSDDDRDAAVAAAARTPGVVGVRDEVRVVA